MTVGSEAQLRILYASRCYPLPATRGVQLRVLNMARLLRTLGRVTLVVLPWEEDPAALEATQDEFDEIHVLHWQAPPSPPLSGGSGRLGGGLSETAAARRWFRRTQSLRPPLVVDDADRSFFDQLRRQHDLSWFHTLPVADALLKSRIPRSFVDLGELNQVKCRLHARALESWRDWLRAQAQAWRWRWREREAVRRFTGVGVCSLEERRLLGDDPRVHVIPNGFDAPRAPPLFAPHHQLRLGFIGNLEEWATREGLRWFVTCVWPRVLREVPAARLRVVNDSAVPAEMPPQVQAPGVELLRWMDDARTELLSWCAMVAPLRAAGGATRAQVLEAFSLGVPVIATRAGVSGLEAEHGQHLLLADRPAGLAKACVHLLQHADAGRELATAAWRLFDRRFVWPRMQPLVRAAVQAVMKDTPEPDARSAQRAAEHAVGSAG